MEAVHISRRSSSYTGIAPGIVGFFAVGADQHMYLPEGPRLSNLPEGPAEGARLCGLRRWEMADMRRRFFKASAPMGAVDRSGTGIGEAVRYSRSGWAGIPSG